MAIKTPKVFWDVTIVAGVNDKINFKVGAGGNEVATLTPGAYASMALLLTEVAARLQAVHANAWASSVSAAGKVTITGTAAFTLLFSTGANVATSPRHILGFGAVDAGSATSVTGALQHQNGYYPQKPVKFDPRQEFESFGAMAQSMGGANKYLDNGELERRQVAFAQLPNYKTKVYAESATYSSDGLTHTNEAAENWWRNGRSKFRYWPDYSDEATSTDYCLSDGDVKVFRPARLQQKELYGWAWGFWRIA